MNNRAYAALVLVVLICQSASAGLIDHVRMVALSDQVVPNSDGQSVFEGFLGPPSISENGDIAFRAQLSTPPGGRGEYLGIVRESRADGLRVIAQRGTPVSGAGDGVSLLRLRTLPDFGEPDDDPRVLPLLNRLGRTAFPAGVGGSGVNGANNSVIVSERAEGGYRLVAREGMQAPGTEVGVKFGEFEIVDLNDNGHIAFVTQLTGTAVSPFNSAAIFGAAPDGSVRLVARAGSPLPGNSNEVSVGTRSKPLISRDGRVAFSVPQGVSSLRQALFMEGVDAELVMLAGEGTPYPSGNSLTLGGGRVAFKSGGAIIRSDEAGDLSVAYRSGDAVSPSSNTTLLVSDFIGASGAPLLLNNSGAMAFLSSALVDGTRSSFGVFREDGDRLLKMVIGTGDAALGIEEQATYDFLKDLALSDGNRIAIQARFNGPGIDATNDEAIYAEDLAGELRLIARKGALLDVSNDPQVPDLRTISRLDLYGERSSQSRLNTSFSGQGELVFLAQFTDGSSGIFLSTAGTVPEPGTLAIALIAGLIAWTRRPVPAVAETAMAQPCG